MRGIPIIQPSTFNIQAFTSRIPRREFLCQSALAAAAVALLGQEAFTASRPQRPNVILINADDLGYADLGCYGSDNISTPNLDRLAREGVRFTDFYACAPVCTPSRAGLLTGRYPIRSGLTTVLFPNNKVGIPDTEITIAELLKRQGYSTACIGKWHLGHLPQFLPTRHGFDYYYGIPYSNDMGEIIDGYPNVPLMCNEETIERPAHIDTLTQRYTEEAVRLIRAHGNRPFFIYLAHTMPHKPLYVNPRFKGHSRGGKYGDVVEEIDWGVGRIVQALRDEGLQRNTLVMFTSDNGPVFGKKEPGGSADPFSGGKGSVFEGGMREPFIARWPARIRPGGVCHQPASNLDILPTLVTLGGGKVPKDRGIDGRNIAPLLTSSARLPDYAFFYDVTKPGSVPAVRFGRWKLRMEKGRKELEEPQLFDLDLDPGERRNVAAQHPEIVADLKKRITAFLQSLEGESPLLLGGGRGRLASSPSPTQ
ncbi:MAG: sulfatase [Armatimonadota bacterium]|nr:sulfatase [Armatimonadota bacterium]